MSYIGVGVGGIIGTLLRYVLGAGIQNWAAQPVFPVGTLTVNLVGCFALGWFSRRVQDHHRIPAPIRTGVSTGLIGSFTTFSTFSAETVQLFRLGRWESGIAYLVISMFGGLCLVWLGTVIGGKKRKEATHG